MALLLPCPYPQSWAGSSPYGVSSRFGAQHLLPCRAAREGFSCHPSSGGPWRTCWLLSPRLPPGALPSHRFLCFLKRASFLARVPSPSTWGTTLPPSSAPVSPWSPCLESVLSLRQPCRLRGDALLSACHGWFCVSGSEAAALSYSDTSLEVSAEVLAARANDHHRLASNKGEEGGPRPIIAKP